MSIISLKPQSVDSISRQCSSRVEVQKVQEPLAETAEFLAELVSDGADITLESKSEKTFNQQLIELAEKNAELESMKERMKDSLQTFKQQVQSGQLSYNPNTNDPIPNFVETLQGLYNGTSSPSSFSNHAFVNSIRQELSEEPELNDDDELAVVNTNSAANLKSEVTCPITTGIMSDPVTSSVCKHSFDRDAIMAMIGRKTGVQCPVFGCSKMIKKENLQKNDKLERKVKKFKTQEEQRSQVPDDATMFSVD